MNPRPLYKCQGRILQSEALPMLSLSSRKDEPNAVFPVSIVLQVWILEAIFSSCMHVRMARSTCHFVSTQILTQPRSHRYPVSNVVGPVRCSRSAATTKFVKSRATYHRHVPSGTKHIAIDLIKLLSSFRVEQSLSGPNPFCRLSTTNKGVRTLAKCQCLYCQLLFDRK